MSLNFNHNGSVSDFSIAVPSDDSADDFPVLARGLMLQESGPVILVKADNSEVTLTSLLVGLEYNFPFKRIKATGTIPNNIILLF